MTTPAKRYAVIRKNVEDILRSADEAQPALILAADDKTFVYLEAYADDDGDLSLSFGGHSTYLPVTHISTLVQWLTATFLEEPDPDG